MKINGEQAYPCIFGCPNAVWIGDEINGDWYCDDFTHDRSPDKTNER